MKRYNSTSKLTSLGLKYLKMYSEKASLSLKTFVHHRDKNARETHPLENPLKTKF